jgi:predicted GIY-YIG superfamily endonuclease
MDEYEMAHCGQGEPIKPSGLIRVINESNRGRRAIRREKQIKEWKREWKFNLIERDNPHWADLYLTLGLG